MTLSAQSWELAFTYLTWHIFDTLKHPWPDEEDMREERLLCGHCTAHFHI